MIVHMRLARVAVLAFLCWACLGEAAEAQAPPSSGVPATALAPEIERLLDGAIDIHVHSTPDDRPRSIDALDVTRLALQRGMRAIVLKNHYESTAGLAYLVRRIVPDMLVFGGIDLNLTVGGVNAAAVEHMTRVSGGWGRVVWMPTFDAENQVRFSKESRPFVSVSRSGQLLPEVTQVIGLIAKHGLVMATGHSSAEEGLMLVREGRRQGVRGMVVTHAMNDPIGMNVAQMREAASLGAFIEFVGGSLVGPNAQERMRRFADAIREIGPDFTILSSDLGQQGNALPPDGFGAFLLDMRSKGFSEREVTIMSKRNPARLLGLP
jgi:hypothetical protein